MDYKRIYDELITKCKNTVYTEEIYTENHHIIPKCMGGSNESSNLIKLPAREHIFAHILLARIYPDNASVVFAAMEMTTLKQSDRMAEKYFSTRLLAELRVNASQARKGKGNPMYGRKHKESTKQLISKINTGRKFTEEQRKAHSKKMKARVITDKWKENISKGMKGKSHPHKSPNLTNEQREAKAEMCRNRVGKNHPNSKRIEDIETGKIYESITDCAKDLGKTRASISSEINKHPGRKFRFI